MYKSILFWMVFVTRVNDGASKMRSDNDTNNGAASEQVRNSLQ